jgi:uncharacterized membrane protein
MQEECCHLTEKPEITSSADKAKVSWTMRRIPSGILAIAVLVMIVVGIGAILYYGYMTRPGWVGVSGKKFWDYLDLLIVPTAIAIGVAVINWMQSRRERQAEEAQRVREQQMEDLQRERELEVERQRAMDAAMETYLDKMEALVFDRWFEALNRGGGELPLLVQLIRARTLTVLERLDESRKRAIMRFLAETRLIHKGVEGLAVRLDLHDADFSDADLTRMSLTDQNLSGARLTNAKLANTNFMYNPAEHQECT